MRNFDNYLNYFENLLYLRESGQISNRDVMAGFEYWLDIMNRDAFGALRTYTAFGFERLAAELKAKPCTSIFLTTAQTRQLEIHAPSLAKRLSAASQPAYLRCASLVKSGGGEGLVSTSSGEPAIGLITDLRTGTEALTVAAQLDSILDFDASRERIGHRVRQCVRAYIDYSGSPDSWAYLDRESFFSGENNLVSEVEHIVLYGSLRPGEAAFHEAGVNDGLTYVGKVTFSGEMIDLGDYPGVRLGGAKRIVGELFRIDDKSIIERLDRFKHFYPNDLGPYDRAAKAGSLYIRKVIETSVGENAYVYEFNGEVVEGGERTGPIVPSGDWSEYRRQKR